MRKRIKKNYKSLTLTSLRRIQLLIRTSEEIYIHMFPCKSSFTCSLNACLIRPLHLVDEATKVATLNLYSLSHLAGGTLSKPEADTAAGATLSFMRREQGCKLEVLRGRRVRVHRYDAALYAGGRLNGKRNHGRCR